MSATQTTPSKSASGAPDTARKVSLTEADLPLFCPRPSSPLWARHPRVFLDALKTGEAKCPYCGTHYVYAGDKPAGHH